MNETTTPATDPVPALNIQVDRAKVTLGDVRFMARMSKAKDDKNMSVDDTLRMMDMLDRVVIGGIEDVPFDALRDVMESMTAALGVEKDIKN